MGDDSKQFFTHAFGLCRFFVSLSTEEQILEMKNLVALIKYHEYVNQELLKISEIFLTLSLLQLKKNEHNKSVTGLKMIFKKNNDVLNSYVMRIYNLVKIDPSSITDPILQFVVKDFKDEVNSIILDPSKMMIDDKRWFVHKASNALGITQSKTKKYKLLKLYTHLSSKTECCNNIYVWPTKTIEKKREHEEGLNTVKQGQNTTNDAMAQRSTTKLKTSGNALAGPNFVDAGPFHSSPDKKTSINGDNIKNKTKSPQFTSASSNNSFQTARSKSLGRHLSR